MLKIIRRKGFIKKVLWLLTFVIIISFGFWGTAARVNTPNGRLDYAGKIFGKKISFEQFEESQLHARHQALLRYGAEFFKISPFLNLEEEAWNRLILAQEAKRQKIKVNDQEVVESIEALPPFQRDGKFDSLLYNDLVRSFFQCKPRTFEEGIRETILISKLFQKETAALQVSDEEIFGYYKKQKEKIQVSYVLLNAENYKKEASYEEKELKDFYDRHKKDFRIPPTINVEYVTLPFAENIPKEEKNKIEEKINQISEELKKNPDLKSAGTKYGVDAQESGFFSQEQPNLKIGWSYELLKKAFELVKGAIPPPIETTEGYYILKLKERRGSYIPEFSEIQEKIKDAVLKEKAQQIAGTKAAEILKTLKENLSVDRQDLQQTPEKKFNELADSVGLSVTQTPLFSKGEYLPNIGVSRDFQEAAFSLNEQNKLSGVVETPKGFCILYFQGREQARQEDFLKEKDQFTQSLLEEKRSEAINEYLSVLRIKANLQDNIAKLKTSTKAQE